MSSFHQEGSEQLNNYMKKTIRISVAINFGNHGKLIAVIMMEANDLATRLMCSAMKKKTCIFSRKKKDMYRCYIIATFIEIEYFLHPGKKTLLYNI
jgi:hypothetical protein